MTGNPSASARDAARAVDAIRRGWTIGVGTLELVPLEGLTAAQLEDASDADLLISGERAATLKLANQRDAAAPGPVRIRRDGRGLEAIVAIADPSLDLRHPMKGPFTAVAMTGEEAAAADAAMVLARRAGRLPAFLVQAVRADSDAAVTLAPEAVAALTDPDALTIATRARLPIAANTDATIVAFRSPDEASDHVALVLGTPDGKPPLVRLHSECLTGDVFGSLKCDCGPQLDAALSAMADAPWGVLLYLRQEGRGIGLINKLRAYALQDQGFDTVDANTRLGFPAEARDFAIAARMLSLLGVSSVRLMTNNPQKVERLASHGIDVVERVPHALPANPHNARYLDTKRDRTGHLL